MTGLLHPEHAHPASPAAFAQLPEPTVTKVNDPELQANVVRDLSLLGQVDDLQFLNVILPIVNLLDVGVRSVAVRQPTWRSTDIFSAGVQIAPPINTVLADTVALPAGVYDLAFMCSSNDDGNNSAEIRFEHRDAANAATLAQWAHLVLNVTPAQTVWPYYTFGYELGDNERLRAINPVAGAALRTYNAVIFARIRQ